MLCDDSEGWDGGGGRREAQEGVDVFVCCVREGVYVYT